MDLKGIMQAAKLGKSVELKSNTSGEIKRESVKVFAFDDETSNPKPTPDVNAQSFSLKDLKDFGKDDKYLVPLPNKPDFDKDKYPNMPDTDIVPLPADPNAESKHIPL